MVLQWGSSVAQLPDESKAKIFDFFHIWTDKNCTLLCYFLHCEMLKHICWVSENKYSIACKVFSKVRCYIKNVVLLPWYNTFHEWNLFEFLARWIFKSDITNAMCTYNSVSRCFTNSCNIMCYQFNSWSMWKSLNAIGNSFRCQQKIVSTILCNKNYYVFISWIDKPKQTSRLKIPKNMKI